MLRAGEQWEDMCELVERRIYFGDRVTVYIDELNESCERRGGVKNNSKSGL